MGHILNRLERNETGSAVLFFVAVMLPLFFLFFSLFLDLGSYYREQQRAQLALDEAALEGARLLPRVEASQAAVTRYLSRFGSFAEEAIATIQPDAVSLSLSHSVPLTFAQFFVPGIGIPLTAYAHARIDPVDAYIAIDSSRVVAPFSPTDTDLFLAPGLSSTFFTFDQPVRVNDVEVDPRFLTARCFNQLFSSIKRSAVYIHDYLAGFRLNALGVGVYPSQVGITDVRPMTLIEEHASSGLSEAMFPFYDSLYGRATWCAAAAQYERVALADFAFPSTLQGVPRHFQIPADRETLINPASYEVNESALTALSSSEAIWSAVAHEEFPQTDVVLREVASRLSTPGWPARGGLQNRTRHVGIILAGDLPWISIPETTPSGEVVWTPRRFGESTLVANRLSESLAAFRTLAQSNPSRRVQLIYVLMVLNHSRDSVLEHFDEFESLLENAARDPLSAEVIANISIKAMVLERPEDVFREVSAAIVLSGQQAVLSR